MASLHCGQNPVRAMLHRKVQVAGKFRYFRVRLHETVQDVEPDRDQAQVLHATIKAVTRDTSPRVSRLVVM